MRRQIMSPLVLLLLVIGLSGSPAGATPWLAPHHADPGHPGSPNTHYFAQTGDAHHYAWVDQILATPAIDVYYDFRPEGGFPNVITAAQQARALDALALWASVSNLNFIQNMLIAIGSIINIGTGDLAALGETSGPGGILGLGGGFFTHVNPAIHTITGGIAWMDSAETWDTTIGNGNLGGTFDYFTVVVQEIGHALGLGHVDDLAGPDMMDGSYGGEQTMLSLNDIAHIQSIYGAPALLSVSEPGALLLLGAGLAGLTTWIWRRRDVS